MTKLNVILIIIDILIILGVLALILFKTNMEKLNNMLDKLTDSEEDALNRYKTKYDLIIKMIDIVESKYKVDSKVFDQAKELNVDNIDSFKNEKILNKCYKEIIQIKEDNTKVRETKAFKELIHSYNENEIFLIALRTYHNKYTLIYNNMIKKFPYVIISKVKRYNINELIEGQELDINYNNDVDV